MTPLAGAASGGIAVAVHMKFERPCECRLDRGQADVVTIVQQGMAMTGRKHRAWYEHGKKCRAANAKVFIVQVPSECALVTHGPSVPVRGWGNTEITKTRR